MNDKEKASFNRQKERMLQKVNALLNRPDFTDDIKSIRLKFGIPVEGFMTPEECSVWQEKLYEEQDSFYDNEWPKYKDELLSLRETDYAAYIERNEATNNLAPLNNLNKVQIPGLIKKYNVSPAFTDTIKSYLQFGKGKGTGFGVGLIGVKIEIPIENDKETGEIKLVIQDDTTIQDIKDIWPMVKIHQKRLKYHTREKYQPIPNLDLYERAYKLKQTNSYKKTAEILTEELKTGRLISQTDAQDFVKRYKKHLGIN